MDELEELRGTCERQRKEITKLNEVLHRKNVELDALHMVWCDGGCIGGVHRWTEDPITHEVVETAERNVKRLRQWHTNACARLGRGSTPGDYYREHARLKAKTTVRSKEDDSAVERGAAALCRFVFPGYLVPRVEMARAVLDAAADEADDWMDRLPEKKIVSEGIARTIRNQEEEKSPASGPSEDNLLWELVNLDQELLEREYAEGRRVRRSGRDVVGWGDGSKDPEDEK